MSAVDALNSYLTRFADSDYCARYGMSAQTFQFWCRAESAEMADRVQYYVTLGNVPNEAKFIQWERSIRCA
jgi:hypothetical protein